jgi:L-2-hydroxyglutarate oxidase LhgO
MLYRFDVVIVGAGAVGLACAKYFVDCGYLTLVVESDRRFGLGSSSRNSEVVHAGIYYSPNTYKARLCVRGKHLLYEYCEKHSVPYKKIGKWVVAQTSDQAHDLYQLKQIARDNGVADLQFLSAKEISIGEPSLRATEVLYSPSTGILDSHTYMQSLVNDVEASGGIVVYKTPFLEANVTPKGFEISLGGSEPSTISSQYLVNAAGLNSIKVAEHIQGLAAHHIPQHCFAKGTYFAYREKVPFQRLIYPVPEHGGLGIHLTLDMGGQARFGPDVQWIEQIDYQVNDASRDNFAQAIRSYWPNCDKTKLIPTYSGIRPKLGQPDNLANDFLIQTEQEHGVSNLVNLFGIESPGLTASLAIAEVVLNRLVRNI